MSWQWSILLVFVALFAGCGPTKEQQIANRAVSDYFYGDYAAATHRLQKIADKTDENFVLNNLRLGSAALVDYDLDQAESAFVRAYEVINSVGVNDGGRSLGAVLVDEKIKIWKGEPFERAMANFYLGLVYYMQQDYGNARGAFENALFKLRDYSENEKKSEASDYRDVESNFAVAALMLGKCWQKLGRDDLARANFARVGELQPSLKSLADYDLNRDANLLLVIDLGHGPQKVTDFDGSIVGFAPTPQQVGAMPRAIVQIDGKPARESEIAEPTIDLVAMAADRRWQSIDTIRAVKSGLGTGLLAVGAYEGMRGMSGSGSAQRRDLTAAAALLGAGLLLKATSQADVRQWEMLPRSVYVIPLHVSPGAHDITVEFPGVRGLRQEWLGLEAPDTGEATYYMRMTRYTHGPYYWPPRREAPQTARQDSED